MAWNGCSIIFAKQQALTLSNVPAGVEVLHRTNGKFEFVFVLNYSNERVTVPLEQSGVDLLTGNKTNNSIELEPTGLRSFKWVTLIRFLSVSP